MSRGGCWLSTESRTRGPYFIPAINMRIPRREDFNIHDSLDERAACKHFLGKSLQEAEVMFSGNALYYQEDFIYMGPVAFRYYYSVFLAYLQSDKADGDSGTVSSIAHVLEFRLQHDEKQLIVIAPQLAALCRYVLDQYDKFTITEWIYGDLRPCYAALEQRFVQMAGS